MKHNKLLSKKTVALFAVFVLLASCTNREPQKETTVKKSFKIENVKQIKNPRKISQEWHTDTTKKIIPLNEITALLKRNDIKPLNSPRYIENTVAKDSLFGAQPVLALEINGEARAFPLNMLSYHEIVNDSINGMLISIAYCPLCNTAYTFNRRLRFKDKDYSLKFGTSGMLRMSNLVMWDEQTESWWQHIDGEAIVGELAGAKLEILPTKIISLNNFIQFYPNGKTMFPKLDKDYETQYDINNYVHYDSIGVQKPFLFFKDVDQRLPVMEYVFCITNKNTSKAYSLSILKSKKVINDTINSQNIVLFYNPDMVSNLDTKEINKGRQMGSGTVFKAAIDGKNLSFIAKENSFEDNETHSSWNFIGECTSGELKGKKLKPQIYGFDFAFACLAFHPETEVYLND